MNNCFSSSEISNAIRNSIQEYGQKNDTISKLAIFLNSKRIVTNELFQIFPNKDQKIDTYNILIDFYLNNNLCDNEKLVILRELAKLNVKKNEICIIILNEIKRIMTLDNSSFCWELCDLLYSLKRPEYSSEYIKIALCTKLKSSRQMIFLLMGKLKEDCYIPVILKNLKDETVNGHALSALSNYADKKYDPFFVSFLNDNRKWVKQVAQKRLNKIQSINDSITDN